MNFADQGPSAKPGRQQWQQQQQPQEQQRANANNADNLVGGGYFATKAQQEQGKISEEKRAGCAGKIRMAN